MELRDTPEAVQRWFRWMEERPQYDGKRPLDDTHMYECMDNLRFARVTEAAMCIKYEERYKRGCCGSVDQVIEDDDGDLWLVGFNYGH